jgi:hypothetical protein
VLSLQKCRSLLGADCKLTDAELEQLQRELYAVADVAIGVFCAQKSSGSGSGSGDGSKSQIVSGCLGGIPEEERETFEERAAILEYEGGLKKPEAERQAFGEWVQAQKGLERRPLRGPVKKSSRKKKQKKP